MALYVVDDSAGRRLQGVKELTGYMAETLRADGYLVTDYTVYLAARRTDLLAGLETTAGGEARREIRREIRRINGQLLARRGYVYAAERRRPTR